MVFEAEEEKRVDVHHIARELAEPEASSADDFEKNEWSVLVRQFDRKDIFNTNETGMYFLALPDSTYIKEIEKKDGKGIQDFQLQNHRTCYL